MTESDAKALQELLDALPRLSEVTISIAFTDTKEYWIGYHDFERRVRFVPGTPSYGSIQEGCERALRNLREMAEETP